MTDLSLIAEIPVANTLGEGVIWDSSRWCAWWTDIQNRRLFRYTLAEQRLEHWETPERLACFATVAGEDRLIAGFESGFAWYWPEDGSLKWIEKIDPDNPATRLNDGRADRQGRFWAGSMVEGAQGSKPSGRLYRLDHDLGTAALLDGLAISNSLCWSPDSSTLYHCDTPNQRIDAYPFDADSGALGERRTFVESEEGCFPDGSTVDADGFLWNAQWGGSRVVRYSPAGEVDLVLEMPVSQPSCVAFGGADLDLLMVTTAREDLDTEALAWEPNAGNFFIYQTPFRGIADPEFKPSS